MKRVWPVTKSSLIAAYTEWWLTPKVIILLDPRGGDWRLFFGRVALPILDLSAWNISFAVGHDPFLLRTTGPEIITSHGLREIG